MSIGPCAEYRNEEARLGNAAPTIGVVLPGEATQPVEPTVVIPWRDYRRFSASDMAAVPIGAVVEGVKPNELYALQNWLDPRKAVRAMQDFVGGRCITRPIGYASEVLGKPALVLGEGIHRSGIALVNGMRIDVEIGLPRRAFELRDVFRLSALVGRHPDIAKFWRE